MKFWKEHVTLRIALMACSFIIGMILLILGWSMTGLLKGLGIMLVGLVLILLTLALYNKPFEDPKPPIK